LRRVNDFSFFIFVDFYEVNLFQDETAFLPKVEKVFDLGQKLYGIIVWR